MKKTLLANLVSSALLLLAGCGSGSSDNDIEALRRRTQDSAVRTESGMPQWKSSRRAIPSLTTAFRGRLPLRDVYARIESRTDLSKAQKARLREIVVAAEHEARKRRGPSSASLDLALEDIVDFIDEQTGRLLNLPTWWAGLSDQERREFEVELCGKISTGAALTGQACRLAAVIFPPVAAGAATCSTTADAIALLGSICVFVRSL